MRKEEIERKNNFNFEKVEYQEGGRKSFRLSTRLFVSISLFTHLHLYTLELNGAFAFCSKMNSLIGSLKHDPKEEEESTLHLAEFIFQLLLYRQPSLCAILSIVNWHSFSH